MFHIQRFPDLSDWLAPKLTSISQLMPKIDIFRGQQLATHQDRTDSSFNDKIPTRIKIEEKVNAIAQDKLPSGNSNPASDSWLKKSLKFLPSFDLSKASCAFQKASNRQKQILLVSAISLGILGLTALGYGMSYFFCQENLSDFPETIISQQEPSILLKQIQSNDPVIGLVSEDNFGEQKIPESIYSEEKNNNFLNLEKIVSSLKDPWIITPIFVVALGFALSKGKPKRPRDAKYYQSCKDIFENGNLSLRQKRRAIRDISNCTRGQKNNFAWKWGKLCLENVKKAIERMKKEKMSPLKEREARQKTMLVLMKIREIMDQSNSLGNEVNLPEDLKEKFEEANLSIKEKEEEWSNLSIKEKEVNQISLLIELLNPSLSIPIKFNFVEKPKKTVTFKDVPKSKEEAPEGWKEIELHDKRGLQLIPMEE